MRYWQMLRKGNHVERMIFVFVCLLLIYGILYMVIQKREFFGECSKDGDCKKGQHCVEGMCRDMLGECSTDGDCQQGYSCVEGMCRPKEHYSVCESDGDCPENYYCGSNNMCVCGEKKN